MIGIGTELALHSFLGVEVETKPYRNYSNVIINISTIARNVYSAYSKDDVAALTIQDLASQLKDDLGEIYSDLTDVGLIVHYYTCTYKSIENKCSFIERKTKFGEVRKKTDDTIKSMCNLVLSDMEKDLRHDIKLQYPKIQVFDIDVHFKTKGKSAILTHNTIDLLSRFSFTDLTLLESYTGKLKPHGVWYKKLNISYDTPLKLTWFLVGIFGDGNELVSRHKSALIKSFYRIATTRKWDILTTPESMRKHILSDSSTDANTLQLKELIK